ncbi:MAG: AMP-binding protein [Gelidibacter sp.]
MHPDIEFQTQETIKAFQEMKLKKTLKYLSQHSPFYQRLFKSNNFQISDIQLLEDLVKLPTTSKDDLQKHNDDFLCVPKHKIIDYVTTSGTLGAPVTFALTDKDLDRLAYNEAVSFASTGMGSNDTIQLMTTMDRCFMAGLAYFLGARKVGASIVRVGAGVPELQWDSIRRFKPTYLICVPSFLLKLIDHAQQNDISINDSSVKAAICIGEPIRNSDFSLNTLGQNIADTWDIQLYSTYASTEMSTAFTECSAQKGGHLHPDLIIVEILDEQQQPVEEGELGELTITTLGVEAMPLLRFRTGDMVHAHLNPCDCGRNTLRLGPIMGRKQQMIKYKGTTLYPPAIVDILNQFQTLEGFVIEIKHNNQGLDDLIIKVACVHPPEQFLQDIQNTFKSKLRVIPSIELCDLVTIQKLQRSGLDRKTRLVIDKR